MSDGLLKVLWAVVVGVVLVLVGLFLYQAVTRIGIPYSFEYGEGWGVWASDWWGNGGLNHIYYPVGQEPYINMAYTPFFYVVTGILFKVFGPSLLVGRLVSLVACLVASGLVFLIVRKITDNKWYGLLGAVLFFMPPINRSWTFWLEVSTLSLCLSLLGIYLVVKWNGTRKILWSVIPLVLAVYTKQIFIAAPLAVGLYLLVTNRKLLLQYTFSILTVGLGLLGVTQLLTGGNFLDSVFILVTALPTYWQLSLYIMSTIVAGHWFIVALALCAVVYFCSSSEKKELPLLLAVYFLIATLTCTIASSKSGGGVTYSAEMLPVAMILIPILAWSLAKRGYLLRSGYGFYIGKRDYPIRIGPSTVVQFVIPILLLIQLFNLPSYDNWSKLSDSTSEDYKVVVEDLDSVDLSKSVLCEIEELLFQVGRDPIVKPNFFQQYSGDSRVDTTPMVRRLGNKEFALIIQEWDLDTYWDWKEPLETLPSWMSWDIRRNYSMAYARSTDALAEAMRDNYQLKYNSGRLWVYEPKP